MVEEVVEPKGIVDPILFNLYSFKGEQLERFGLIIKGLLGDIQQRLVFRAQVHLY